ncbi:MAG: hypothetical protein CFE26_23075, partial [Verrucomicrobiales bacterium VVV1]
MAKLLKTFFCMMVMGGFPSEAAESKASAFFESSCMDCHDAETKKGGLDLESLGQDWRDPGTFAKWVTIHDRVAAGEMPPKKKPQPEAADRKAFLASVSAS